MSYPLVRLLGLPAAVAVAVAMTTFDPTHLAGAESLSEADVFAAADDPELTAANRELTARLEAVTVRTAMKEDLTDRLLAGRVGLATAADGFLQLNGQTPDCLEMMRQHFPASDDRESAARNVIEYARRRTPAADWQRVRDRLADDYRAAFHHAPGL